MQIAFGRVRRKTAPTGPGSLKEEIDTSMKIPLILIRMLLIIPMCCLPTVAQDDTQIGLPEGAKARLGKGDIGQAQFSPDGSRLAISSAIGIWFYDPATGKALDLLPQIDSTSAFAFAYSPDGTRIARAINNSKVGFWDVTTKQRIGTLTKYGHKITAIAYAPDGTRIVSGNLDDAVRVWNTTTLQRIGTLRGYHTGGVTAVAYAPDGTTIATGCGWRPHNDWRDDKDNTNTVQLWDAFTGIRKAKLAGHTKRITAIAYSPDGTTIATASRDSTVRLWDADTGKHKTTLKHRQGVNAALPWNHGANAVNAIAYSPDGNTIATGAQNGKVRLWDARTERLQIQFTAHAFGVVSIAYSPDGNTIATISRDGTAELWDGQTGKHRTTITKHSRIAPLAYLPDSNTIAAGGSGGFGLWDTSTRKRKILTTIKGTPIAYSPEGNTIATKNWNDTVQLWNAKTGKRKTTLKHTNLIHMLFTDREYDISSAVFSPDGNTVVTVGEYYTHDEGTIYLWHVRTGKRKVIYEGDNYHSVVAFSPDGRTIASGDLGGKIRFWNPVTGEREVTITTQLTSGVKSLVYSPDGRTIAISKRNINVARLWDIATGENTITLTGHTGEVSAIAYSPDGRTIATGSHDRTVRLWDANTGKHKTTFTGYTRVTSILYSPDGRTIASSSPDRTVLLWEITLPPATE